MTYDQGNLLTTSEYERSDQVLIANGQGMKIQHTGHSLLYSRTLATSFQLHNLMHILALTKNLISVSKFAQDNNVFFEFHLTIVW